MYLEEIKPLLQSMGKHKVKQDKFSFRYNNIKFDVIVLIEREPFELLFGIVDVNFSFSLKLYKGFQLEDLPDEVFYKLCRILNLKPGKEGLTSNKFLRYFAERIPKMYSGHVLQPDEIAIYKQEVIDECDKIYFKGWRAHINDGRKARNFEKTKALLGDDAYNLCKANNISSCWGDKIAERINYYSPQEYLNSIDSK